MACVIPLAWAVIMGVTNVVQQGRLPAVNVTHNRHNRWPRN